MRPKVFFVGTESEVAHHAVPLESNEAFDVTIAEPHDVLSMAKPNDIAIFYSEHFDRFRNAIVELKKNRIATLYLIDGILEWRNAWENSDEEPACPFTMRPVLCDKVATIGCSQARVLRDWGNAGKIEVVGIPRLDSLASEWRKKSGITGNRDVFRLLVSTAKTPGFTTEQVVVTKQSLADLKSYFEFNSAINGREIEVVWRLTSGLDEAIGVESKLDDLSGKELCEQLASCDAMITTASTAMLEGILHRIPVVLLDYHNFPRYVPAAWTISSQEAIAPVMQLIALPDSTRMHFQNSTLSDTMQVGESATGRLVQLLNSIFAVTEGQTDSTNPLQFPTNMLPNPLSGSQLQGTHCKMDSRDVFANYNEFTDDMSLVQLQAQLAHSRREIDHLNRIQSGLRSELAEAHSIFEMIQQHPIAGPIVRIRERFIQFMNRKKEN